MESLERQEVSAIDIPTRREDSSSELEKTDQAVEPLFCLYAISAKVLALLLFFVLSDYKLLDFTLVLILSCIDFWIIKNIIGKKLVGMIWWMRITDEGGEEWIYHSSPNLNINPINEGFFWFSNIGVAVCWGITALLCLFVSKLFWATLAAFCLFLGILNLVFYMKCRGNHQQKFQNLLQKMSMGSAANFDFVPNTF